MGDFIEDSLKYLNEEPDEKKKRQKRQKKHFSRKWILLFVCLACAVTAVVFAYCATHVTADISAYGDREIEVAGLKDESFYITPRELSQMKISKQTVTGKSQKAGTFTGVGPTMAVFLAQYGETVSDFKQVKFYAEDDYTIVLVASLQEKTIILSVANGSDPLKDNQQPLRIVIPGEDSSKWIRNVVKIEFTRK